MEFENENENENETKTKTETKTETKTKTAADGEVDLIAGRAETRRAIRAHKHGVPVQWRWRYGPRPVWWSQGDGPLLEGLDYRAKPGVRVAYMGLRAEQSELQFDDERGVYTAVPAPACDATREHETTRARRAHRSGHAAAQQWKQTEAGHARIIDLETRLAAANDALAVADDALAAADGALAVANAALDVAYRRGVAGGLDQAKSAIGDALEGDLTAWIRLLARQPATGKEA